MLLELAEGNPSEVSARGEAYVRDGVEDVVFAYIRFDTGLAAHLHLSWLDPHKMRKITVVGSDRMATLDDMALERKLTIWDKGFDPSADTYGEYITRSGAVWSPAVPNDEPLRLECEHFVDCVLSGRPPAHRRPGRRPGGAGPGGAAGIARRGRRAAAGRRRGRHGRRGVRPGPLRSHR